MTKIMLLGMGIVAWAKIIVVVSTLALLAYGSKKLCEVLPL
jgi:hypothetical protein